MLLRRHGRAPPSAGRRNTFHSVRRGWIQDARDARELRWGTNAVAGTEQWISTGSQDVLTTWTAVCGNNTYMADLSYYRSQIVAVVPEPGAAMLVGMALAAGAAWATIRRK
jgi:hypothetical protein